MALLVTMAMGCATVPIADHDADAEAKRFVAPPGKARIYVFRLKELFGDGILFQVALDGANISGIAPGTFRMFNVDPGKHSVSTFSNENQASVEVVAEAEKIYFLDVSPKMGLVSARVNVTLERQDEGRQSVLKCKLAYR